MALTGFPKGSSSFGIPVLAGGGAGPFTGAVKFVGNRSGLPSSNGRDPAHPFSTITAGVSTADVVKASTCGTVILMPGHSESTATTVLTGLIAGTRIIGDGNGSLRPTIRLTDTAAQLAIAVANCYFENILFRLEGANGITKAIAVTAADCTFVNCEFEVASGATAKSTIALELGTGADRARIINCKFRGTATHNVTDCIKVAGAIDQVEIVNNRMIASATAGNGLIHITGAATNILVAGNRIYNTHTASSACIKIDDVASDGLVAYNDCANVNDGTAANQGVVFAGTTNTTIKAVQNFSVDEKGKSGVLAPGAVAT